MEAWEAGIVSLVMHCITIFFFIISNNFKYKAQLIHTLLTMQVSLRYSTYKTILTLLTIRATYEGNTILNTVLTESTITFITILSN